VGGTGCSSTEYKLFRKRKGFSDFFLPQNLRRRRLEQVRFQLKISSQFCSFPSYTVELAKTR